MPAGGSSLARDTTTVVCTATDASGNSSNCSFTVTVNDTEPPTITCPANVTISADIGSCDATGVKTAAGTPLSTGDNCSVAIVGNDADDETPYPVGTNNVVWTVTDTSGNSATCTQ